MEQNINVERAVELLRSAVSPLPPLRLPATDCEGLVLAEDLSAPMDQPPWPRSPLDGYALRSDDSSGATPEAPVALRVRASVMAGERFEGSVGPGEAVRLMTGAPLPDGCDCVLRQEDTDGGTETVRIYKALRPFENYVSAGADFRAGELLLPAGTRLAGVALGLLASAGLLRPDVLLPVRPRLRCALLCTGDELTAQGEALSPGRIYSSNAPLLASRLRGLGVTVSVLRDCVRDEAPALAREVREALAVSDLAITTGGVSVGARDALHEVLPLLGAERVFQKVRLKPGSPLSFSLVDGKPLLCLSGNPFAAAATFELFARPLLAALGGGADLLPLRTEAALALPFPKGGGVPRYVRGQFRDGLVTLPESSPSGQLRSAAGMNCLACIPAGAAPLTAGMRVEVLLL